MQLMGIASLHPSYALATLPPEILPKRKVIKKV
jgi:hypothetical protein